MRQSAFLEDRKDFIRQGGGGGSIRCEASSVSGAVSQRACVYCGARVVLNPITDAYHIVHGPIGCASYTWDIRGSLSSGSEVYRNSFSTDLGEKDVVFGGAKKLTAAIDELVEAKASEADFHLRYLHRRRHRRRFGGGLPAGGSKAWHPGHSRAIARLLRQ